MKDIDLSKKQHSMESEMHDMTIKRRVIHWIRHNFFFFIMGYGLYYLVPVPDGNQTLSR